MRFFPPETSFAKANPLEYDAARAAYQRHVDLVAPKLPPSLLSLARGSLNLQEASVRRCTFEEAKDQVRLLLTLHAGAAEQVVELVYEGVDPEALDVETLTAFATEPQSEVLYDEVDVLDNGAYAHRILFSPGPGRELELRFSRFAVRPAPWPLPKLPPAERFVRG
jgi:hypothetical protein